jgi:APA family basic amino acid/polyamine antiporter
LPKQFVSAPIEYDAAAHTWSITGAILNMPAMAIIAAISGLLVIGIRGAMVNTSHWITAGNPSGAFIPPNAGTAIFGLSGVIRGAAVVFFAFIGFDAMSTAAQEAKNPMRDMPIGILGSLAICTMFYVAVAFVLTGIVPYDQLNVPDPIAVGIDAAGLRWLTSPRSLSTGLVGTRQRFGARRVRSSSHFAASSDGGLKVHGLARPGPPENAPLI